MEKTAAESVGDLAALEGLVADLVRRLDYSLNAPRRNRASTCSSP